MSSGGVAAALQQTLFMPLLTRVPKTRVKSQVACLSPGAVPALMVLVKESNAPSRRVALASGLLPVLGGNPFLTGLWGYLPLPGGRRVDVGTPLLFDVGVYLVVIGMTLTIVLSLAEE